MTSTNLHQNYLVYTNSLLFMRCGGDSRLAGVMLAIGTFGIMVIGPVLIGYIPIMLVGALIFLLGIDLMREALVDTWGKLSRLEYLTVCIPPMVFVVLFLADCPPDYRHCRDDGCLGFCSGHTCRHRAGLCQFRRSDVPEVCDPGNLLRKDRWFDGATPP